MSEEEDAASSHATSDGSDGRRTTDREALVFRSRVARLISQARERKGDLKRQRKVVRLLRRRPGKPGGGDEGGDSSSDNSDSTSGGEGSGACAACGKHLRGQLRACKGCHAAHYCNARCQRAHWRLHRDSCRRARCGGEWTMPHSCGELRVCQHCHTLMFPGERTAKGVWRCCDNGKYVLSPELCPPIDDEYRQLCLSEGASDNSRWINGDLAFGTQGFTPSKTSGVGRGFVQAAGPAFVKLNGKVAYHFRNPWMGSTGLHNFMLPEAMYLDAKKQDFNAGYGPQAAQFRDYLIRNHPLANTFSQAMHLRDGDGRPVSSIDGYMKMSTATVPTARCEVAMIRSNDEPDMPNDVLVCDVRSGGKEVVTIPSYNKWWELLMYPLLFPTGAGGHYSGKMPYAPQTTTGKRVTLFQYVCRMFYQYEPLTLLGRLAQEWGLNNFQRYQGDVLNFQRKQLQGKVRQAQRSDVVAAGGGGAAPAADVERRGEGARVIMTGSVPGTDACVPRVLFDVHKGKHGDYTRRGEEEPVAARSRSAPGPPACGEKEPHHSVGQGPAQGVRGVCRQRSAGFQMASLHAPKGGVRQHGDTRPA